MPVCLRAGGHLLYHYKLIMKFTAKNGKGYGKCGHADGVFDFTNATDKEIEGFMNLNDSTKAIVEDLFHIEKPAANGKAKATESQADNTGSETAGK